MHAKLLAQFLVEDSVALISIPTLQLSMIPVEARSREQALLLHIIFYDVLGLHSLNLRHLARASISRRHSFLEHQCKHLLPEVPWTTHHVRVEALLILANQLTPPATNSIKTALMEQEALELVLDATIFVLIDRRLAQPAHGVFL